MKKQYWYIAGASLLIFLIMGTKKAFGKVTTENKIRGCDPSGCGHFGADRGSRLHQGIDIVVKEGEIINSPIDGEVIRYPFPYSGDINYKGILIRNKDFEVKIFYINPTAPVGKILKGQKIGNAQNIAKKYPSSPMTNHIHLEVRDMKGNLLNPSNLF